MKRLSILAAPLFVLAALQAQTPQTLPPWTRGILDIHQISTGRGNAAFSRLPDGTTLLVDVGDAADAIQGATAFPDASRPAGEWVARYIKRQAGEGAVLDYALVTHFHIDHMAGLPKLAEQVPIRRLLDRGYPDYGAPVAPLDNVLPGYQRMAETSGIPRERAKAGRADQIVLARERGAFPSFEARVVAVNGEVWTGVGVETATRFPRDMKTLPEEDRVPENPCSIALRIRYGDFTYYTGGDLYGLPEPGAPAWWDVETPIGKAIGPTDVMVVNHHASPETASPFFLSALRPRVVIVPAWAPTHPSPDSLKRLLSRRIWKEPRDIFVTRLREPTKLTIGPRASQVASDAGHVVVRVEPGGASYRVFVLDDTSESGAVKSVHGPYGAGP